MPSTASQVLFQLSYAPEVKKLYQHVSVHYSLRVCFSSARGAPGGV